MKALQPRDYRTICAMRPLNKSSHGRCLDKHQVDTSIMHHCLLLLILRTVRYLSKLQQVKIGNQLSYRAIAKMHTKKKRKTNHFILVFGLV